MKLKKSVLEQLPDKVVRGLIIRAEEDDEQLKADLARRQADAIVDGLDLSDLDALRPEFQKAFNKVGQMGAERGRSSVRILVPGAEDFALPNERVTDYARDRAAELVGKRVLKDGTVINNPNPMYAITDGTRTMLRETITTALTDGWTREQLIDNLQSHYAFSEQRSALITRTELSDALVEGNMASWEESGQVVGKRWLLGSEHDIDDICDMNAQAGVIPLGDAFPSGDTAPTAHPKCVCDVEPVLGEE